MITLGSVYGHGFGRKEISELQRRGFALRPQVGRYPGTQVLRFVDFGRGPALEFIEVTDPAAYAAFVPKGMVPYSPGISLVLPPHSRERLDDLALRFPLCRPYHHHVNYDGTQGPRKPGWNYLNFGIPLVRDTFIWVTSLDEPRPSLPPILNHPNGAIRMWGLCLDVETAELRTLAGLVGGKVEDGVLRVGETIVWTKRALHHAPAFEGKQFPLVAVVLEARDLTSPALRTRGVDRTQFLDRPAIRIRTNALSWDLVVVEARPSARVAAPGSAHRTRPRDSARAPRRSSRKGGGPTRCRPRSRRDTRRTVARPNATT
jgi:hypothetical protein